MKINYVGNQGDFTMENPEMLSYLYFPIANESGVMSSVAPDLAGDSKMSQNSFLMPPVSCENLHNDKSSRNVWCKINGKTLWSLTGRSAASRQSFLQRTRNRPIWRQASCITRSHVHLRETV